LRDLDFDMSLENGKLQIAPATVIYENGSASIDCTVDAVSSKPEMAFRITAEDIDIGALLAHFHAQPFVKGQLNLVVDLQSSGKSPREIATALEGESRSVQKWNIGISIAWHSGLFLKRAWEIVK
jgi:uncharacterized protein involved in outer membrane biogenesis